MRMRIITIVILAAIGSLLIGVNSANAGGWGCFGVSSGCYGVKASCCGVRSSCYGCYGGGFSRHGCYGGCFSSCHGCYGCYGGHHAAWAHRRATRRAYACHGCYGWHGCHGGCYSSCHGGCYGCHGCYGSKVIYDSAPMQQDVKEAQPAAADPAPAANPAPTPPPVEGARVSRGTAVLAVNVPAGAKIYVNGSKTKTEGRHRRYMSPGLISGRSYRYEVQAVVERDGRELALTKSVTVTAGSEAKISFDFDDAVQPEAVLTLNVRN